jgi:hypothetical protein
VGSIVAGVASRLVEIYYRLFRVVPLSPDEAEACAGREMGESIVVGLFCIAEVRKDKEGE